MLRGKGDYRIERWSAGGVPLVLVIPAGSPGPLPVVVIYHRFSGRNTDDLLRLALPLADSGVAALLPAAGPPPRPPPHRPPALAPPHPGPPAPPRRSPAPLGGPPPPAGGGPPRRTRPPGLRRAPRQRPR